MLMESHIGLVMANDTDPDKQFGVECRIDSLLPGEVYPVIVKPLFAPNGIKVPDVNVNIEVLAPYDDEHGFPGERDLGQLDTVDEVYWTGRFFDVQDDGKLPAELLTNYPKRAGLLWDLDGTIIYYDSSDGNTEFKVKLTDGKTFFSLKPDEVVIQQDTIKFELKNKKMITTVDGSEIGAPGANHPIPLADLLKTFLETVQSGFGASHTHTYVSPVHAGPVIATGGPSPSMPAVPSDWLSTKHFTNG